MDQNNEHNSKKLPTALNREALSKVKGGYREMPGISAGSSFVRWDEIDIRFDSGMGTFLNSGPNPEQPGSGTAVGLVKPRP